jgi:glycosyltransferase involved in cell wall biosynthesis
MVMTNRGLEIPDDFPSVGKESNVELSIVMPCLNEAETLGACIDKAQRSLQALGVVGEVIVADNGSTDGSAGIASRLGARVVHIAAKGYGSALMGGIEAARGKYIIMGDADDSYDFSKLGLFLEKLRDGYDLVMGNRFKGGIQPKAMPPLHRYLGNPVLSGIGRMFFHCPCGDFHCGLRGFRKASIISLDLRTTGMEFASEMVVKATLQKMRIAEVPTSLSPARRSQPSHLRSWRDGWRHLRFMLLYSPYWLFLAPGCSLLLLGAAFGGILLTGPVEIGGIGFDTNTLLVCAMALLIGFKLIVFATFAKLFAISEGLLPQDPRLEKILRPLTLEAGIAIGLIFMLIGFALLVWGVLYWEQHEFGAISYPRSLRLVIPGVTAFTLGAELIFSSFFIGILGLRRK